MSIRADNVGLTILPPVKKGLVLVPTLQIDQIHLLTKGSCHSHIASLEHSEIQNPDAREEISGRTSLCLAICTNNESTMLNVFSK